MNCRFLLLPLSLALFACGPNLVQLTFAPPGSEAELDESCDRIELSTGVAMAVACHAPGGGCEALRVSVADDSIAEAHVVYTPRAVSEFQPDEQDTSFVVVGKSAGTTTIKVETEDGDLEYEVAVVTN